MTDSRVARTALTSWVCVGCMVPPFVSDQVATYQLELPASPADSHDGHHGHNGGGEPQDLSAHEQHPPSMCPEKLGCSGGIGTGSSSELSRSPEIILPGSSRSACLQMTTAALPARHDRVVRLWATGQPAGSSRGSGSDIGRSSAAAPAASGNNSS